MAQVLIRQLDDQLVERLRQLAKRRGLSLEQSLRDILRQAAAEPALLLDDLARLRSQTPAAGHTLDVAELIREGRAER
jgi:plasmid stability protein